MKHRNIYKILFFSLLTLNILFAIFVVWVMNGASPINPDIKKDCKTELEATNTVSEVFKGVPKPVDFSFFPEAKIYRTKIAETVQSGSNFAGHFSLIYWGCGTDCYGYAIVDNKTGKAIAYSPTNPNQLLQPDYGIDSNYFVLIPVNAGSQREYYKIVEEDGKEPRLILACTEISDKGAYRDIVE